MESIYFFQQFHIYLSYLVIYSLSVFRGINPQHYHRAIKVIQTVGLHREDVKALTALAPKNCANIIRVYELIPADKLIITEMEDAGSSV